MKLSFARKWMEMEIIILSMERDIIQESLKFKESKWEMSLQHGELERKLDSSLFS
jgi:hypothetical protein